MSRASAAIKQQDADMYRVKDKSARGVTRHHEVEPGVVYGLKAEEYTLMPAHHALIFLSDENFIVENEDGEPLGHLPRSAIHQAGDQAGPKLAHGEVIARYDELTQDALLARATRRHGGEKLTKSTKRAALVDFLINSAPVKEERDDDLVSDGEVEMGDDPNSFFEK